MNAAKGLLLNEPRAPRDWESITLVANVAAIALVLLEAVDGPIHKVHPRNG